MESERKKLPAGSLDLNMLRFILLFRNAWIYWFVRFQYMLAKSGFRRRIQRKDGFGTLEIVIIIAVLLAIALIFRKTLLQYANRLINAVFDQTIIDDMGNYELK